MRKLPQRAYVYVEVYLTRAAASALGLAPLEIAESGRRLARSAAPEDDTENSDKSVVTDS